LKARGAPSIARPVPGDGSSCAERCSALQTGPLPGKRKGRQLPVLAWVIHANFESQIKSGATACQFFRHGARKFAQTFSRLCLRLRRGKPASGNPCHSAAFVAP
jgi:hypothetical protein